MTSLWDVKHHIPEAPVPGGGFVGVVGFEACEAGEERRRSGSMAVKTPRIHD